MATILVTGFSGGLSQRVAIQLLADGHSVVGVDYRDLPLAVGDVARVTAYKASYNKTAIEDVFKHHTFDSVLHLGRAGNLKEAVGKRFDLNVVGSQKIWNLCKQHQVKRLIVLSTFHIYGAHPANHIPIHEDEPLRAGTDFPQIADAIQLDNMAAVWTWQHDGLSTAVLRPTNVVGPTIANAMSTALRASRVPYLAGYNPMTQFIHETDLADAIIAAEKSRQSGIFNVAGRDALPWRTALDICQAQAFPLPSSLVSLVLKSVNWFPAYLVNFFKYPCIISDEKFRKSFGWEPKMPLSETLWTTVAETRARARALRERG